MSSIDKVKNFDNSPFSCTFRTMHCDTWQVISFLQWRKYNRFYFCYSTPIYFATVSWLWEPYLIYTAHKAIGFFPKVNYSMPI